MTMSDCNDLSIEWFFRYHDTTSTRAVGVMRQAGGATLLRANTKLETTAKAGDLLLAGIREQLQASLEAALPWERNSPRPVAG